MIEEFEGLDLDEARKSRAAEREGKKKDWPIRIGGEVIAVLPAELPFTALTPLRAIDDTIALVFRNAMTIASDDAAAAKWDATRMVVDLLASAENLPQKVIQVIQEIAANLLTPKGVAKFMAANPSVDDIKALAMGIFKFYGVSLGESSPSSDLSTDGGGTSPTTSDTNYTSTPEGSGTTQENPPS